MKLLCATILVAGCMASADTRALHTVLQDPAAAEVAPVEDNSVTEPTTTDTRNWFQTMINEPEAAKPTEAEKVAGGGTAVGDSEGINLCSLLDLHNKACIKKAVSLLQISTKQRQEPDVEAKAGQPTDDISLTEPSTTDTREWFHTMVNEPMAAKPTESQKIAAGAAVDGADGADGINLCSLLELSNKACIRKAVTLLQEQSRAWRTDPANNDPTTQNEVDALVTPIINNPATVQASQQEQQKIKDVLQNEPIAANPSASEQLSSALKSDDGIDICSMISKAECAKRKIALVQTKIAQRLLKRVKRK
mmetsp:Transcript_29669/g.58134  ORF Transcript_29669/g.58134 Transcript_29669/m.58134 type:complete len:307 (+) Transcript_29669:27-947(+)|eukprot:CAMPEP_0175144690 /NCGR_PEP_ID=MMETSP0087-20121206/14292_1 /TAXON_ID=136419 /ORGANISM="Unknown Unknown, Strain D1" /LENGTH=306 /DNA_ID=CAMNT_0016429227 /DNA_START=27 /DNA_END=947 /DNA_ORIENTATION=-